MDGSQKTETCDLVIERTFDAPRELIWKLWTDAAFAARWFGPESFTCISFEADGRPGGKWRGGMRRIATGDEHWASGEFREVTPPEHILYTYRWEEPDSPETVVDVRFEDAGEGRTRMTFRQGPFMTASNRDGHTDGWSSAFNKLAALAAEAR